MNRTTKVVSRAQVSRALGLALGLLIPILAFAQAAVQRTDDTPSTSATSDLAYDVAAIRPSKAVNSSWGIDAKGDTLSVQNAQLIFLLAEAYDIRVDLISGLPHWADSARYDFQAKILDADPDELGKLSETQRGVMLQKLLAERFHLKVHTETKTLPVYDLVLARSGVKLATSSTAPEADVKAHADKFHGVGRGSMSIQSSGLKAEMVGRDVTTAMLSKVLSDQVNRTVIDKTGLTASYDVSMTWALDNGGSPDPDATGASIFTALQEQLGLKLVAAKGPVETLVVDRLDRPTEN